MAQALADDTRLHLLALLQAGPATVSELAVRSGLPQPRASSHLAILRAVGLVQAHSEGRHRTYEVDVERVGVLLDALEGPLTSRGTTLRSERAEREVRRDSPVRQARTCYGHLAGVAGVRLLDGLVARGWLRRVEARGRQLFEPTEAGVDRLRALGIDEFALRKSRRMFAFGCLDWTERRPHLGGALAVAMFERLADDGVFRRVPNTRVLEERLALSDWLSAPPSTTIGHRAAHAADTEAGDWS